VAQIKENGLSLLLYKDARCDMNILDETVGEFNWKREHCRDNANCIVSIWDAEKGQWISKEDTGTESNTEAEKGLASDSFKRACVNWGIGRELYTAPFIWVTADKCKISGSGGKLKCHDRFEVKSISYNENREIDGLSIVSNGHEVFTWSKYKNASQAKTKVTKTDAKPITQMQLKDVYAKLLEMGSTADGLCRRYDLYEVEQMNTEQYSDFCKGYEGWLKKNA
jgi:hypothetical protein